MPQQPQLETRVGNECVHMRRASAIIKHLFESFVLVYVHHDNSLVEVILFNDSQTSLIDC